MISGSHPWSAVPMRTCTLPRSVNLNAFASRFLRIWRRRWGSVTMLAGRAGGEVDRVAEAPLLGDGSELSQQGDTQLLQGDHVVVGA